MVLENTETDRHRDMMPVYFGHMLCTEFSVAEITYGVGRSVFCCHHTKIVNANVCVRVCLFSLITAERPPLPIT